MSGRVQEVFEQAVARPRDQREAFLAGACAADPELRAGVETLLSALDRASGFMDNPTAPSPAPGGVSTGGPSPLREGPGTRIGPYKLLQLIGEGGFGTVFMAEQTEPVVRRVALKIIKLGMDTRQVIARFEAERQALAMMDHPNIAKVFDAGATDTGRPFFVMELVKGDPITQYCDKNNLGMKERLELFGQVCNAVQHAHTKGIIHRDIKPNNVLVTLFDGRPVPKVIDFGIAKAMHARLTEKTLFTELHQLVGTPEYMSPEQAEATGVDIDTRSDIYSLGVLLYELLTGSTPFESKRLRSAAYGEIQRIIREEEPQKPSTRLSTMKETLSSVAAHRHTEPAKLGRLVRGDLDWVVMRCLEKDRTRRYETANGLAMDVQRHLAGEPVLAAPPSTGYKLRKFVKRNRAQVIAGGIVAGALVLATGVSVWFGMSEARQRAQTEVQRAQTEVQRAEAVRQQGIAEASAAAEAKARKQAETISEFVTTALKAGDAENTGAKEGAADAGYDMTILAAMDNAIKDIDSGRFKDDPETEAALRDTIGVILLNNGKYDKAKPLLEQALAMCERLFKGDDPTVADSLKNLARLYLDQGQYAQAEPLCTRALAIDEKAFGPDHPSVATALSYLALLYRHQGHYAQAEPLYTRALAIYENALGPDHPDVANALNSLAVLYNSQGQYAKAEPLYTRALAINEKALGPDHPSVANSLSNLANLYIDPGQYAKAESLHTRALAIREKAFGPDHPEVARSLNNLAAVYLDQGQYAQAEPLLSRSLASRERAFGPDHPDVLRAKNNLAALYWNQGKLDKSVPLFEEVLKAQEAKLGRQHPATLLTVGNLGVNYKDAGRLTEAIPLLEEAYRASKQNPQLDFVGPKLLDAYTKAADPAKPESTARVTTLMQEMLADARGTVAAATPQLAAQLASVGQTLLTLKAWDEAEPLIREALTIREAKAPDAWSTFNTRSMLGGALLGQNKLAEAEPLLLDGYQGMKEREAAIPALLAATRIPEALERLVRLYEAKGNETEAAAWRSKLEAARAEQGKPDARGGGR